MCLCREKSWEHYSHTADMGIRGFGGTLEEAFTNSAAALMQTIAKDVKVKEKIEKKIEVKGKDIESLLYDFLEEFLFLLDAEDFLLAKIKQMKINKKAFKLSALVIGDKASNYNFTNDVKAITYSGMLVKKEKNKYICQVVLDV